ncbi:PLP-dependent transferase [Neoconidiobolus thromboides FSU 785]|nr:PLP-dependent transferase [Neoconidiobolus thromboides FSU 785]
MGQGKFKSSIGGESKLKTQWQRLIELGSFDNESKKQVSSTSITTEPAKPSMIKGERASSIQLESYATKETNVSPAIKKTSFVLEPINEAEKLSVFVYTTTVFSYCLLFLFGYFRDLYGKIFKPEEYKCYSHSDGYAPLVEGFERSFHRYVYTRIRDVFARTITGVPGRTVKILERTTNDYNLTFEYTGNSIEVMNLASYNYLGFSEKEGYCTDKVIESITQLGVTSNSTPCEVGYSEKLVMAEQLVARFVGTEDAVIISQGFSTNASVIPTIVDKGCLILSDELNHASLIYGSRISGAVIRPFKHNT